jgi:outer membrane protein TolC
MKFLTKTALLITALSLSLTIKAQYVFTVQNAIDTALLNNFDIQIAKNNVEIARMNNTYGVAGGLPYISASAGDNASLTTINQKYSDGTETNLENRNENAVNAGISAGIVLFNGFRVTATKERLSRLQDLSEIELNQQVQNIIADIMVTYYDIIRQQNYLRIIENTLEVSQQKLDIVNVKNNVGMADAAEILQTQSDVNSAGQLLEIQKLVIEQNKSDLFLLINAKTQNPFSVSDSIIVDKSLQLDSILTYLNRNPQYLSADQQVLINEQLVKEITSQRYPSVKLNAGYDFYHANSNNANLLMNQSYGPTAGVSLQVPIFNGNIYKTQSDVAKIRVNNSKLEKESLLNALTTQATKLYRTYSITLQQIESQRANFEMNTKLLEVVMQKFNLGQSTILDVKAAQTSYENAAYLLVNLLYSAKVAEIELKQLTYSLQY